MRPEMLKTEVFDNLIDDDQHAECEDSRQSAAPISASSASCGANAAVPRGTNSGAHLTCLVCGDTATGRHYGSVACNGCKGFFRRTIRRAYKYSCRFNGNCQIDKHNRAVCRACRYARCIKFGMKVDAVQNERDLIGKRGRYTSNSTISPKTSPLDNTAFIVQQNSIDASDVANVGVHERLPIGESGALDTFCSSAPITADAFIAVSSTSAPTVSQQKPLTCIKSRRISGSGTKAYEFRKHYSSHSAQSMGSSPTELGCSLMTTNVGDLWQSPQTLLELLMNSEEESRRLRDSVIQESGKFEYTTKTEPARLVTSNGRRATIKDIFDSLHSQLLLVIEWAKNLKPFAELNTEDQTALLKNFASQHIVLSVAYRSINASDSLKLINDSCISRTTATDSDVEDFYKKDCERVMDTLVAPMRFLKMDDVEFVTLKACILFNPVARGLSNESVLKILDTRRKIFGALEFYVTQKVPREPHRIGDLTFFILSPLQCLAKSVSEDVLVTKLSGVARIDQLMEELILEDSDTKQLGMSQRNINLSNKSQFVNADLSSESSTKQQGAGTGQAGVIASGERSVSSSDYFLIDSHDVGFSAAATTQPTTPVEENLFRNRTESAPSLFHPKNTALTNSNENNAMSFNDSSASGSGVSVPSNLSPIHDFEMLSTLSSYVLGGPLQGPISSPSNDVLLSSCCAVSEPPNSPSPSVINSHQFHPVSAPLATTVISSEQSQTRANLVGAATLAPVRIYVEGNGGENVREMTVEFNQQPQQQQPHQNQLICVSLAPPQRMPSTQQSQEQFLTAQSQQQQQLLSSQQIQPQNIQRDHEYFSQSTEQLPFLRTSHLQPQIAQHLQQIQQVNPQNSARLHQQQRLHQLHFVNANSQTHHQLQQQNQSQQQHQQQSELILDSQQSKHQQTPCFENMVGVLTLSNTLNNELITAPLLNESSNITQMATTATSLFEPTKWARSPI